MKQLISMREALADPRLLGGAIPGPSWLPWRAVMIASLGEPLTTEERAAFQAVTGREREPMERVEELWGVVGRRGGKTRSAATLGAYISTCCEFTDVLAPGERGVLPILAASTAQASRAFMHIRSVLEHSPALAEMIEGEPTADTIRLTAPVDIVVRPANFRTIRGITAVAAICDEVAFWMIEGSVNPDAEILNALRPALATTEGMLAVISSPYAKRGEVYGAVRQHYGPSGDPRILVAKGPSKAFNSTLPQRVIDRAYERDAAAAASEYGGEFRDDIAAFVTREVVEACIAPGLKVRPPVPGLGYVGFVDPSGGLNDSMTLAIAHREGDRCVLDLVVERKPPMSPEAVVEDFCGILKAYGVTKVTGDRWGGEFVREPFRKRGIAYDLAEKVRSELYRDLLPALNSGQADLLDLPVLINQLVSLERRVARSGRESIDHPPNGHDDVANAVAGAIALVSEAPQTAAIVFLPRRIRERAVARAGADA